MNKQMQGVLLILAYEVLIGVSPIVTRTISNELSSGLLVFARYGIGSVVLLAAVLSSKQLSRELVSLPAKLAMGLVLLGILGSGLASALSGKLGIKKGESGITLSPETLAQIAPLLKALQKGEWW